MSESRLIMVWRRQLGAAMLLLVLSFSLPLPLAARDSGSAAGTRLPEAIHPINLEKGSRLALAKLRASGERQAIVLVAATPGRTEAIAQQVQALGGEVHYRADEVAYLRVVVPIDRIEAFLRSDGLESIEILHVVPEMLSVRPQVHTSPSLKDAGGASRTSKPSPVAADTSPRPPRWSDYPLRRPYPVLRDIDAERFRAKHPAFDGRGVTIAHVESVPDILLPELQTAYTLEGRPTPKVADVINVSDPRYRFGVPAWMARFGSDTSVWVEMGIQVKTRARRLAFLGHSYTTPREGTFRMGYYLLPKYLVGLSAPDLPAKSDQAFGVLWNEQTDEVWVDANRDLSFADEQALTEYARRRDVGRFGVDNPSTSVRETIGFTVQIDKPNKAVAINRASGIHPTVVIGAAVANRNSLGLLNGIAPGARLVTISFSMESSAPTNYGFIEGLIAAFQRADVDLITSADSGATDYGSLKGKYGYALRQARHPIALVVQRLTECYSNKLFFNSGGNGPGLNQVAEEALGPLAVSVGAYQSQDSYLSHYGFLPEGYDHLHWNGRSHGPSGTGALKPDLLAPSGVLSLHVGYLAGGSVEGLLQLPPGYDIGSGTSTAAPVAGGAVALVVSAAKRTGVRYDAARLKAALTGSARYLSSLASHEQGNGLVQVEAAYELLKKLQHAPMVIIESRAPVRTQQSHLLRVPNEGVGLYEREGWLVGMKGTRTLRLKRTSGPGGPMTFALSWQGNDGTFSAPDSVTLPLNRDVELQVGVEVKTAGAHSSILSLTHPDLPVPAHRILHTVIAPLRFTAENGQMVSTEVSVPLPDDRGVFVEVPPGVAQLDVLVSGSSKGGTVGCALMSPSLAQYEFSLDGKPCTVANPEPGVWEINLSGSSWEYKFDPNRPRPLRPATVNVAASITNVEITGASSSPRVQIRPGSAIGFPVTLRNRLAPVSASLIPSDLGSGFETERDIAQGEQHIYEVMVPEGATSLSANVAPLEGQADLDIYMFYAGNEEEASVWGIGSTVNTTETTELRNPDAGLWKIIVDAHHVPGARTRYRYLDLYTHPGFGAVSTTDAPSKRATGDEWETRAHVWIASSPQAPRVLIAPLIAAKPGVGTERIGRKYKFLSATSDQAGGGQRQ